MSVTESLQKFFDRDGYPILFTGAGVSVRAGLPTWKQLVEKLAEGIRSSDPMTTQQMLDCVNTDDLTLAIDYFKLSRRVLAGDKQQLLVRLLSGYDPKPIQPVARLPFRGCLTTNFDRSLIEAIVAEKAQAARDYKFGDQSFKQAQWEDALFIARIHGAIEAPDSIVLSESQFTALLSDESYADLLGHCFLHRNLLFLGFSFYDPAVRHVLQHLNRRFGVAPAGRHLALLPSDANSEFLQKANRLNIDVVQYDPSQNHAELWSGIEAFKLTRAVASIGEQRTQSAPFGSTKKFLAACYARAKTQHGSTALRTAVLEGIVSAILQEFAPQAVTKAQLLDTIRFTVGLRGSDAESIIGMAVKSLVEAGLCRKLKGDGGRGAKFAWNKEIEGSDSLDHAIQNLTKSVRSRALLQEGWQAPIAIDDMIANFFNKLIRRRGWDLGAAFAAGRAPENVAVESLLTECTGSLPTFDRQRLLRVCQAMFQHPSEEEASILGELGRISFAVELAFQSPRSVLLHNAILPRHIYFDASVLLPALVTGHPFSAMYLDAIDRLRSAASAAAIDLKLRVCTVYLNEIISHRNNAQEYGAQGGDDFASVARSDALFHGVTNVNVYVGAYANWINSNKPVKFEEFLSRFAPYKTELQLKAWLKSKGFEIVDSKKVGDYADLYSLLERAYADRFSRGKGPILIEHDATQLSLLLEEAQRGERTLFITADRRLQEVIEDSRFSRLSEMMMSHVGLVQFIDLLLGGISDGGALTELLWSTRVSDKAQAVRSYYTARGLEQYDDGMAMAMPQMLEKFADAAAAELQRRGADLDAEDPAKRAEGFRVLGSLEKNYLSGMSEAVVKLRESIKGS